LKKRSQHGWFTKVFRLLLVNNTNNGSYDGSFRCGIPTRAERSQHGWFTKVFRLLLVKNTNNGSSLYRILFITCYFDVGG
jgi:hypothetical protein